MSHFIHLHNHTHYSILDAICTPEQLILEAMKYEQNAVALTDHGVMFGCYEFYKIAKAKQIKPLIGFEAYVASGSRFEKIAGKSKTKKRNYYHLVLLAKNMTGYKNLLKLTSLGHTEGFYYKPRIDEELLEQYHEGIIALSACFAGVINAHLINGDPDTARSKALLYQQIFGDDFYLELQHHSLPEDTVILDQVPKLAKELGIKLVATNDVHYLRKEDAIPHNIHLLIKDASAGSSGADVQKLRYRSKEMYFKSSEEMAHLFADFPDALSNTLEVSDKCELDFEEKLFMPQFDIPKESKSANLEEFLRELTYQGLNERFETITDELKERADYELDVINNMGFPGYFLIVQDFMQAAKELGVSVGPGRGSAAGSLVAYALRITNINPLPYDLLFERFLNPERVSMPDIDIDFSDETRERVIEYCKKKYGKDSVAQIITFGKLSTRAVLKDVGRVLGIPHTEINLINKKIPVEFGKVKPLAEAIELPELKEVKESKDEKMKLLLEYAPTLENLVRNTGIHAAGVVIAPGPVSNYVPLYQSPSKNADGEMVTQYSMNDLESAGLLKMDFLGLKTLSIIDNTLAMIKVNHNEDIDIDAIDFHDEQTFDLLSKGNTQAIFQFESKGMQEYLRQLKPKNLEELTAMNALYRPGPMENIPEFIDRKYGRKPIEYIDPVMEKSLKNTYGIIVYQEQVMQLARDIAGFSLGQADILRRAMGKKKDKIMDAMKPDFLSGAAKNNISEDSAQEIWNLIMKFAKYGFNKSHSLAYSYLAFQTAWLKTHYPPEFLAANMSAEMDDQNKIVQLIEEAKKFDIEVLPPDVNQSKAWFTAKGKKIFFGLAAIRNVGVPAVESIVLARKDKPFESFFDFVARVDTKLINKRALEALIFAGAFDSLKEGHRAAYLEAIESALDYARSCSIASTQGDSLFGGIQEAKPMEPKLEKVTEWSESERLKYEKEYLNFYISGNPLDRYISYVESLGTLKLSDTTSNLIGEKVEVCGIIQTVRTRLDKNQNTIAFIQLEDFAGRAECIFWSDAYAKAKDLISEDNVVFIRGQAQSDGEDLKIIVDTVLPIEEAAKEKAKGYNIWLDETSVDPAIIKKFHMLCNDPDAKNTIIFNVYSKNKKRKRYVSYNVNISMREEIVSHVMKMFGRDNVRLLTNSH